jgi:hypothetical protein
MPISEFMEDEALNALGSGLEFPIRVNQEGGLAIARHEQKVRQSVWTILSTARGERVMRPDFGCDIHSFVFATRSATNLTLIKSAVREALLRWEPRIEVEEVDVAPDPDRDACLRIRVNYRVRLTNTEANMVYPFYLQPEA